MTTQALLRTILALCFGVSLISGCNDAPGTSSGGDDAEPDQAPAPEPDPQPVVPDPTPVPEPAPEPDMTCGDGVCGVGETTESCAQDCPPEPICTPGQRRCASEDTSEVCGPGGLAWTATPCGEGRVCDEAQGVCLSVICAPGEVDACASQSSVRVCDEAGTGFVEEFCEPAFFCDFIEGIFGCTNRICTPGETRCLGLEGIEQCLEDGTGWMPIEACPDDTRCDNGACTSLCEINAKVSSFLGCEYWSVDLDNVEGGSVAAHAVVISNPHPSLSADITVTRSTGEVLSVAQWPTRVGPGQQGIFIFESSYRDANSNAQLIDTGYVDGTMIGDQAFRFESSIPTTEHQFNPLVESNVLTNDASLMLPTNTAGVEHLAMSWKHRATTYLFRGFINVLAFAEEPTTVQVTPTARVMAGTDRRDDTSIDPIEVGETREFVLSAGQFLNIETDGPELADLTGTHIISDQPVIVYSGHECANLPEVTTNFCDHIEQQMVPLASWGSRYVISAFLPRAVGDIQLFRVLAAEDQTVVTTSPPQPGADSVTLQRGEFIEFESGQNFELEASAPVLVGQFMVGATHPGGGNIGDPAFTLAVPIEQWRRDYIFLTPQAFGQDHINVMAPTGTEVLIDGLPIGAWETIGDGTWSVVRRSVPDGTHTVVSDTPFSIIAYGYDRHVSYAYPGGLNLEDLGRP